MGIRPEQRNGTYLFYLLTGQVPTSVGAQEEIDAGKAMARQETENVLSWGGSDNQDALAAACARLVDHPHAGEGVNLVLDRELAGVFHTETGSSYGQYTMASVAAIWWHGARVPGLNAEAEKARRALRSQFIACALFCFVGPDGRVHHGAPACREHSKYHRGLDVGIARGLGMMDQPVPPEKAVLGSPRYWLLYVAINLLERAGLITTLFTVAERNALVRWIKSRTWSTELVTLLTEVRLRTTTHVEVTTDGLRAWHPKQLTWDDPRPGVEILHRQELRELRGVDPEKPFVVGIIRVDGKVSVVVTPRPDDPTYEEVRVANGLALWPDKEILTRLVEADSGGETSALEGVFTGAEGIGRSVPGMSLKTGNSILIPPFRRPHKSTQRLAFSEPDSRIVHRIVLDSQGVTVDGVRLKPPTTTPSVTPVTVPLPEPTPVPIPPPPFEPAPEPDETDTADDQLNSDGLARRALWRVGMLQHHLVAISIALQNRHWANATQLVRTGNDLGSSGLQRDTEWIATLIERGAAAARKVES